MSQQTVALFRLLVFALLAWSLQATAGLAAPSDVHVDPGTRVRLLGNVESKIDPTGNTPVEAIARTGGWSVHTELPTGGDWQQTPVWYRFTLLRTSPTDAYAITWPGIVGRIDVYCDAGGRQFWHQSGGYDAPVKSLSDHVLILPDTVYGHACYLRALTGYYLSSPSIMPLSRALGMEWSMAPTFGGFFIAIALFNFLMFLVLRRVPLLVYTITVTAGLMVMVTDDTLWRYIPSTPFWREFIHEFFGWLEFALSAYFAYVFLALRDYDPKVARALLVLVVLSALELVAGLFPQRPAWVDNTTILFLVALLTTMVVAGVRAGRRGYRGAWFYVIGICGVFIGIMTNVIVENFALPVPEIVIELYAIGVAWEALWLTVALADRMSEVVRENIELRMSRDELQVLAELDPLTGVPNRRAFDDHLHAEWNRAQRAGTPLCVIMIDVDHFKEYNDTLGHVQGDLCLSKIAHACASSLMRSGDYFARYGGEEFVAILVTQNDADLAVVAERMRSAVAGLGLEHPTNVDGIVTISLGVARMIPTQRDHPLGLVDAADTALYAAKERGRNQVGTVALATS